MSSLGEYEQIKLEQEGPIAILTLCRPDKMNAFTGKMMYEMLDAFDKTDANDDIRAVIVTGAGDRAFCAGADLSEGAKTFDYEKRGRTDKIDIQRDGGGRVTLRMFDSLKPVIGAINGAAVGIGVTMQLPMDIRIASDNARFGFVFNRRGINPEAASSWFLPRLVGIQQALEWCPSASRVARCGQSKGAGDCREYGCGLDHADAAHDVAYAGRQPSDGRPHCRQRRHLFTWPDGRRAGRGDELPRKAQSGLSGQGFRRHAGFLPMVGESGL